MVRLTVPAMLLSQDLAHLEASPKKSGKNAEEFGGLSTQLTDTSVSATTSHCSFSTSSATAFSSQWMTRCGRLATVTPVIQAFIFPLRTAQLLSEEEDLILNVPLTVFLDTFCP